MEHGMKILKLLLLLLPLTARTVISQVITPGCKEKDTCSCAYDDGSVVELKYLGEYIKAQSGYLTTTHASGTGTDTYNFNPCSPFTIKAGSACDGVVSCQHHPDLYDIGTIAPYPPEFSNTLDDKVKITYTDKTGYQRATEVTCVCDTSYTGMPAFTSDGEKAGATFVFEMRHQCCCKDACKDGMPASASGMSGGSVLLILVFVVVVLYLVLGGLFMKYKRGAIGSEIIPNKSFWSDFPTLVKDGALFVISPCTKRGSYNKV